MLKTKKTLRQFILFTLFSLLTTVVDLGLFALFQYLVFSSMKNIAFSWWIFDYSVDNGGLGSFLSFALSFLLSQTFNFIIQRKATFQATNRILYSAIAYMLMVIGVFALQLWIPTILRIPFYNWLGDWGDLVLKNVNMTISFLIQFPMNKWVIMTNKKAKKTVN